MPRVPLNPKPNNKPLERAKLEKQLPAIGYRRIYRPDEIDSLKEPTWGEVVFASKKGLFYTVKLHGVDALVTISLVKGAGYT